MTRVPLIAIAAALSACSYDQAFKDYCTDFGACSCNETTCCMQHGTSCHVGFPCCDGFVCSGETGTCRRPADAVLELSPASYDFGWVDLGEIRTLTVTVTNAGPGPSSPLTFADVRLPFRVGLDACSGQVLAPGASCSFQILFEPTTRARFLELLSVQELVSSVQLFLEARSDILSVSVLSYNAAVGSILSYPSGLACPLPDFSPCSASFRGGTQITLTRGAPLDSGYFFDGFYGDCYGKADSCWLTVDVPSTVSVWYLPNLTLIVGQGGVVSIAGTSYPASSTQMMFSVPASGPTTLTADPQPPAHFTGWSGACEPAGLDAGCFLDIAGPVFVYAGFAP